MLERLFKLKENRTTIQREIVGGSTTFLTMSYIIFVQPAILSAAGMDFGAVMTATCVSSGFATILLGLTANYPIALAPAMGHNVYFAFVVCVGMGVSWQVALGANFISGALFVVLAFFGLREKIIAVVPSPLRYGIAAGIGMLIAFLGFQWSGLVVDNPAVLVGLGDISSKPVAVSLAGLTVMAVLVVRRVPGALLIGLLTTTLLAWAFGLAQWRGVAEMPPSLAPTFLQFEINTGAISLFDFLSIVFVFFFLDLFDTVGTLIGVGERGGFMRDGRLPRARQALFSDAVGTVVGTALGTSTVTSYVESSTGVAAGARTGLANIVTGLLFFVALFFSPVVQMVAGGYELTDSIRIYPIIAPALIVVGVYMMGCVKKIDWEDFTESIPAFLTMAIMTYSLSITEGIAFGFISYALLKAVSGGARQTHPLLYLFAILFLLRYCFL